MVSGKPHPFHWTNAFIFPVILLDSRNAPFIIENARWKEERKVVCYVVGSGWHYSSIVEPSPPATICAALFYNVCPPTSVRLPAIWGCQVFMANKLYLTSIKEVQRLHKKLGLNCARFAAGLHGRLGVYYGLSVLVHVTCRHRLITGLVPGWPPHTSP